MTLKDMSDIEKKIKAMRERESERLSEEIPENSIRYKCTVYFVSGRISRHENCVPVGDPSKTGILTIQESNGAIAQIVMANVDMLMWTEIPEE